MTAILPLIMIGLSAVVGFLTGYWRKLPRAHLPTNLNEVHRQIEYLQSEVGTGSTRLPRDYKKYRLLGQLLQQEEVLLLSLGHRLQSPPTRSEHFLLAIAVRLLPSSERGRYLEEFRAELSDVPRNTRLRHALSLLRGVFVLRMRRGLKRATDAAVRRVKS